MAHYALLDENNIVTNIIVGKDEHEVIDGISDWEAYYYDVYGVVCKRTSYNTFSNTHKLGGIPFRKNYAHIGYTYDESRDAFIPPKPFNSWVIDEETCQWISSVSRPNDNKSYIWNEDMLSWIEVE